MSKKIGDQTNVSTIGFPVKKLKQTLKVTIQFKIPTMSKKLCQVGENQRWLAHQCSPCEKFVHT